MDVKERTDKQKQTDGRKAHKEQKYRQVDKETFRELIIVTVIKRRK